MKVVLLRTWLTNIGNGFIDKGARQIIEKALPNAEIVEVSGYPNYAAEQLNDGLSAGAPSIVTNTYHTLRNIFDGEVDPKERMVNVSEFVDADVAVFPGCTLYPGALDLYENTLRELSNRGMKIVFLGAGGGNYLPETQRYVKSVLKDLDAPILITRDTTSHDIYSDLFAYSYNGIDCAFFIDEWYQPPDANRDFVVSTFDKSKEPDYIQQNYQTIIRPEHNPLGHSHPFYGIPRRIVDRIRSPPVYNRENIFVSDTLEDYLFWFKNANITHSDRIHSCVPTLVYGNQAQFYYDSPRGDLFENAPLDGDIRNELVSVKKGDLEELKSEQVNKMEEFISLAI
ncbi:polysaccharide pyruvyl transferase family protein [Natronococcus occultus]|uniref:Polysaccharide pyruvyl transferase domain-containing protein n=1 Tax=Natronococcus occultus SP4 TaxID=694430 RepID=L0K0F0_9EURY|nr:polysaccharide pyruvyl transferase family protein [Natronococcus occultus]AGB38772.1 hypothetical protein Natoc_3025 [Natronococcus occultus SP4]